MLPTDEKHENMLKEICKDTEHSQEAIINYLINRAYKEHFGGK